MATNKNALIRYKHLDMLLSDRHHYYDINDLTEKVNDMLYDDGFKTVTRRCIEKDLVYLTEAPFRAPIKHFKWNGKNCVAYKNASFSIFKQEMSNEERTLLREVLNTIGQFEGLDNFEWLDKFKVGLGNSRRRQIISFSNNPYLANSNLLGTLFDFISNKVVVRLSYHTFTDATIRSIDFHPYLLKQYNDRWFLLGSTDGSKKILNFALDRIDQVVPMPERKYLECPIELTELFDDIVGVTLYEDKPVEHILCWVSNLSRGYILTKQEVKAVDDVRKADWYEGLNISQLLERVIKNIGCHIDMYKEEKDHFYVTYQGEHFTIIYSETSPFINIYDVAWYSAELDDIDNLSLVRQAVNACNRENLSTVLYTIDKENKCINVHTRQSVVFGAYIPNLEDYLRSRFEDSFRQHHNYYRCMEEIRKEQYAY